MLNRSHALAALIICTSVAFAQEAATPPVDTTGQAGNRSSASSSSSYSTTPPEASAADQSEGFSLPGGMGYAPLDFTPGQGRFDRKPLSFGTTIQQGYDDNVEATSGDPRQAPVKGSLVTALSEGVDLLLAQSRYGLSLGANAGGQYYWDRAGDQLTPNGGLNLIFGYKLTPRVQFSAIVNGIYTTQPTLTMVNGLAQSNGKGYLTANSKFDLLYRWTPRFSTDTAYSINGIYQSSSIPSNNNNLNQIVSESFRYAFSHLVTGVLEGRYSRITYNNLASTNVLQSDSNTYYALAGADVVLSRRFSGALRAGSTTRDYQLAGQSSTTSPYAESTLNYTVTRTSALNLDVRYGYDDSSSSTVASTSKSIRTGLSYSQAFTSKLRGTAGVSYSHIDNSSNTSPTRDALSTSLGLQYALSQSTTLFGSFSRMDVTSSERLQEYTKDVYYLGATFQY
ncbi:MAG: outer membrane beta-barrel protein [Verrucomicrobiota bacterium]